MVTVPNRNREKLLEPKTLILELWFGFGSNRRKLVKRNRKNRRKPAVRNRKKPLKSPNNSEKLTVKITEKQWITNSFDNKLKFIDFNCYFKILRFKNVILIKFANKTKISFPYMYNREQKFSGQAYQVAR